MSTRPLFIIASFIFALASCSEEEMVVVEPTIEIDNPITYDFTRDGQSTVAFSGQTTRIQMGEELISAMKDFGATEEQLLDMFANENSPFADAALNESTKSVKSKTAASEDYYSANTAASASIKAQFETWMRAQVTEVFPNENEIAEAGKPGQIADGSSTRYVNAQGLEYNQMVNKGLIGALMLDQTLNNYLGTAVLDAGTNREDNTAAVILDGKAYTNMEHKWDEAYGYVYGTAQDVASPNATIGSDDSFLNKYIGRVEGDSDFAGIAEEIYQAFKLGRAAIVAGDYETRDVQANILRKKLSEVIGVRAVYYLMQGKTNIENGDLGAAFHDLSEGYGFIYSLQFTRQPDSNIPYFTGEQVDAFLTQMLDDGANGLWDVQPQTLESIATDIAAAFDFSLAAAAQ